MKGEKIKTKILIKDPEHLKRDVDEKTLNFKICFYGIRYKKTLHCNIFS